MWAPRLSIVVSAAAAIMLATPAHAAIDGAWAYYPDLDRRAWPD